MKENRWGISGNGLKWIALITMLIDHVGAVIVIRMLNLEQFDRAFWLQIYSPLRSIGRVAFPIFLFLLVEGFLHTRNVGKYLGRLLIFAVISEIPFNLAIAGSVWSLKYQNVYWELALGLVVIWLVRIVGEKPLHFSIQVVLKLLILTAGMVLAEVLALDYGLYGMISIFVIYQARDNRFRQAALGAATFLWENPAPLAFLPILCYNGKRGRGLKFAFYVFYPAHLLVLYLIARAIGCPY